jgi:lipopolysaccharide/colanic/teichoic acid biosynthesis glycosyltransferase
MSRALFLVIDFVAFLFLVALMSLLRYGTWNIDFFALNLQVLLPTFALATLTLIIFSFYDLDALRKKKTNYKNLITAFIIALTVSAFCIYFLAPLLNLATPKRVLLSVFIVYFFYIYIVRRLYAEVNIAKHRILIFGESKTLEAIKKKLKEPSIYQICGEYKTISPDTVYPTDIDTVLIASKLFVKNKEAWPVIADNFISKGILLTNDFNFYEMLFKRVPPEGLQDEIWLLRGIANRPEAGIYHFLKRFIDILFCLILLPFLLPLIAFVWLLIKVIDRQPPFFFQERTGKLEATIYIYKFRTLKIGTENPTKLGAVLRMFRLDEIPQILNILKGEISITGPRPVWTKEYRFLNSYIPLHAMRGIVKPGVTGWAQLNFKAPPTYCVLENLDLTKKPEVVFEDALTRLAYDIWYIKNRNFFLDAEIILKTAKRMFIKDKTL